MNQPYSNFANPERPPSALTLPPSNSSITNRKGISIILESTINAALKRQIIASRWTTDPSAIPVRAWQSADEYFLIGAALTLRMNKDNELRACFCDLRADHWFDPAMGFNLVPVSATEAAALIEHTNTRWNLVFSL